MCEFISWIEDGEKVYYLTYDRIHNTPKGKALKEYTGSEEDLIGHGAIRYYYGLDSSHGINKECTDFSSPKNFPVKIAARIKAGEFNGLGSAESMLTTRAKKLLEQGTVKAGAEYNWAWVEYNKAWAEYDKAWNDVSWELFTDTNNRKKGWR